MGGRERGGKKWEGEREIELRTTIVRHCGVVAGNWAKFDVETGCLYLTRKRQEYFHVI